MYSVFLVEDEIVIRDGLKTSFPWSQYGFTYVGDAADGEMALPLIRQTKPDVLITDIRMPFMDGIALSKLVKKELPGTRIIIISGYDDFAYAQEAISIGVDKYILKPVTRDKLAEVMSDARKRLDAEQQKGDYYEQFRLENQEYERFARVNFFNNLVAGTMSVSEVYEKAEELSLDLTAPRYNLVLLNITPKTGANREAGYSNHMAHLRDQMMQYFLCCPEYLVFHWNLDTYAVIVKGDEDNIDTYTENCITNIARRCSVFEDEVDWYVAQGDTVSRFSEFADSCAKANRKLSCRYMNPAGHIFTTEDLEAMDKRNQENNSAVIDQKLVGLFLENAMKEEIDGFLENLVPGNAMDSLNSTLFCQYFAMTMYVCVSDYIKQIGHDPATEFPKDIRKRLESANGQAIWELVREMFNIAIGLREGESQKQYKGQLLAAMTYVDNNYTNPNLSLNEVAKEVNISSSYLSAMFSREAETTFVEYMTGKRMSEAAKLLRNTDEKSSIISEMVGYKDPHYFSYIFKKTYGMTPKEYRTNRE